MKKSVIILVLVVLLSCSFISADIIFSQPIGSLYNLGDSVSVPVTIKTLNDVSGVFEMNLICNGTSANFYRNGITLAAGDEKSIDASLVLINNVIGSNFGICKIKASMSNREYALSNDFKISNLLSIQTSLPKIQFNSGENLQVSGKVTRENGESANGFIEADLISRSQNLTQLGTITNGNFNMSISLPGNLKAGNYILEIKATEKNSDGTITNKRVADYNVSVNQVPTNLEIIIENSSINPGDVLMTKVIVHDQTGGSINSEATITIKDSSKKIVEEQKISTDQILEYQTKASEPPSQWEVFAISGNLSSQETFNINIKEDANIVIANQTISITNTGNVPYNKTLFVKVGDTPLNLPVYLAVGETKKYVVSAPNGQYQVSVVDGSGNEISQGMSLTGGAVGVRELSGVSFGIGFWILVFFILGMVVLTIFRKVYKKPFIEKQHINPKKKDFKENKMLGNSISATNKAELSLSIKGEQQDATVICVRVRDLKEMKSRKGSSVSESIQKIIDLAEENKAVTYENLDYLFFIFAPVKTRTFKNEKIALDVAEKMDSILTEHNKMFNQKIDFGISLNYGTIVAKIEDKIFKFMSMGTLITASRKIAHLSKGEVLLSEKVNDLLRLNIRTEKSIREGMPVFIIKEIKRENEEAKKFIDKFMQRQSR